jgi:ketosteroid isomerase-like protein
MKYLLMLLPALLIAGGCSKGIDMNAELDSLVAAEHEFAQRSVEIGSRRAFLEFFADDAILFRPHPVPAKEFLLGQPDDASLLTWRPILVDISRSCDLGYTTGPWEYRANGPEDSTVIHGHYISVWRKQPDGIWKVVIDTGTSNPPLESDPDTLALSRYEPGGGEDTDAEREQLALLNRDRAFSITAKEKGISEALLIFARDEARVFRGGAFPYIGKNTFAAAHMDPDEPVSWEPIEARISRAGDLGFTYGHAVSTAAQADSTVATHLTYLRIWKKTGAGSWNVVIDVMNPSPPPDTTLNQ